MIKKIQLLDLSPEGGFVTLEKKGMNMLIVYCVLVPSTKDSFLTSKANQKWLKSRFLQNGASKLFHSVIDNTRLVDRPREQKFNSFEFAVSNLDLDFFVF